MIFKNIESRTEVLNDTAKHKWVKVMGVQKTFRAIYTVAQIKSHDVLPRISFSAGNILIGGNVVKMFQKKCIDK